jgi:hypothetical protein
LPSAASICGNLDDVLAAGAKRICVVSAILNATERDESLLGIPAAPGIGARTARPFIQQPFNVREHCGPVAVRARTLAPPGKQIPTAKFRRWLPTLEELAKIGKMKTRTFAIFISFCFLLPAIASPDDKTTFNVRSFGAVGDGKNLDSPPLTGRFKPHPLRAAELFLFRRARICAAAST